MINLTYNDGMFFAVGNHADARSIIQRSGFTFHQDKKMWYTTSPMIAVRLREYADSKLEKIFNEVLLSYSPWAGSIPIPQGLHPIYYQVPAAKFALSRNRSYLAMDPGLGKTPTYCMVANALHSERPHKFVYTCPPFLVDNVESEFQSWSPHMQVEHFTEPQLFGNIMILPDSRLAHEDTFEWVKRFIGNDPAALCIDEAHRYKHSDSQRSRALLGYSDRKGKRYKGLVDLFPNRVTYMSGTPMERRPLDLYSILSKSAPETIDFMTREEYGLKFCAGRYDGYGYDFSGASNVQELGRRIKGPFMFRLKKDALSLPPVIEDILVIQGDMKPELRRFENSILKSFSTEDIMKGKLSAQYQYDDIHLMTYQRLLGLEKVAPLVEYIEHILEDGEEDLIVFARHTEVIERLAEELAHHKPLVITGKTPTDKRYRMVQTFQQFKGRHLMIGNLKAMGVGFNLTKANRVLNCEPDWLDSVNSQGRDRAHRYGQKKSVYVQHVCYKHSIDKKVLESNLRQRKMGSYI